MPEKTDIAIIGMARTPMTALLGESKSLSANDLGSIAIEGALKEAPIAADDVELVYMGNVLQAGQGQAPARQAAIKAGLPIHCGATTVNKMCGSGMQAVLMGRAAILAGDADIVVSGGMESMTQAPHLIHHRAGHKYGAAMLEDHMEIDGLKDPFGHGSAMGVFADQIAARYQFTRKDQDAYALRTLERAQTAIRKGRFSREIAPVSVKTHKETVLIDQDELPRRARPEKIPQLKPAFSKDGTVTAANASAISDGAAALVLMKGALAARRKMEPIARIIATSSYSHEPELFTTAPVFAIRKLLEKAGWDISDVDLWEINEAFAVVPMIAIKELGLDDDRVNIHGGACAMGHPIGASGARIMVTLISALEQQRKSRGVAALCIGGGEATAIAIERS